jgi:hypothetical protein
MNIVSEECHTSKIRARNVTKNSINMAVEVRAKDEKALIAKLMELEAVTSASLVEHDGDVTV